MNTIEEKLLKKLDYYIEATKFEDIYNSHPNYPSLYATTDTYTQLGIENAALRINKEQINELPQYFIAQLTPKQQGKLVLVTKKGDSIIYENDDLKKNKLSIASFLEEWNGIVVLAEKNTATSNDTTKILPITLLSFFLITVILLPYLAKGIFSWSLLCYQLVAIIGSIIGYFVIEKELSAKINNFRDAICNLGQKKNCETVLDSSYGVLPGNISLKLLPISYFITNLLFLAINPSYHLVGLLSILGIPLVLYSIYLQSQKIKAWCTFCLLTASLMLLNTTIYLLSTHFSFAIYPEYTALLTYIFTGVLSYQIFQKIHTSTKENLLTKQENYVYKRFKNNPSLFISTTSPLSHSEGFEKLNLIELGDANAPTKLTLFLSPFCGHCHKAFAAAIDILNQLNKTPISITIGFNVNISNKDNPGVDILQAFMNIYLTTPEKIKDALSAWHIARTPIEEWKKEWVRPIKNKDFINYSLQNQYNWCQENNFNYTPAKVINGNKFPKEYSLNDIKYLLEGLHEKYTNSIVNLQSTEAS
ncbi:hypothetical protein NBRC110019_05460 [Neptunitalea chrysea]|uniref:Vitamin K epoxide reductase domain-containing protein n=1 Tax=Neptunitalea chrysea TaxID=1647581 RepID=A0A9W6B549_9FLAO|nr:vitamin K epoxide reductase family protein [Neptunitalea chrysea]GLB51507.1 hypothetical protein NBRC110019_05460 [Neptunitalea chrysea]